MDSTITDVVSRHADKIIKLLKNEKMINKDILQSEVYVASLAMSLHHFEDGKEVLERIIGKNDSEASKLLSKRYNFYESITKGRKIHGVAILGIDNTETDGIPSRITLALLDCLLSIDYVRDYDNAPLPIFDIFELASLIGNVLTPIIKEFELIEKESMMPNKKSRFCSKCGNPIDEYKVCTNCGAKYFSIKRFFRNPTPLLVILLIMSCCLCFFFYTENTQLKSDLEKAQSDYEKSDDYVDELVDRLQVYTSEKNELNRILNKYYSKFAFVGDGEIIYHKYGCEYLDSKYHGETMESLEESGCVPCFNCY